MRETLSGFFCPRSEQTVFYRAVFLFVAPRTQRTFSHCFFTYSIPSMLNLSPGYGHRRRSASSVMLLPPLSEIRRASASSFTDRETALADLSEIYHREYLSFAAARTACMVAAHPAIASYHQPSSLTKYILGLSDPTRSPFAAQQPRVGLEFGAPHFFIGNAHGIVILSVMPANRALAGAANKLRRIALGAPGYNHDAAPLSFRLFSSRSITNMTA